MYKIHENFIISRIKGPIFKVTPENVIFLFFKLFISAFPSSSKSILIIGNNIFSINE